MQSKTKIIVLFILLVTLAACKPAVEVETPASAAGTQADAESPDQMSDSTPTPVPVSAEKASVTGEVVTLFYGDPQPMGETIVRLAKVHWNEDHSDAIFVLEGATSPSTISQPDGSFAFVDVNPGEYVLVVGDVLQDHEIITDAQGEAVVYPAPEGEVTDLGLIEVYLEQ